MVDARVPGGGRSRLDAVKAGMKRALIGLLVIDALFVAGALALYLAVVRPRMVELEGARDAAVRASLALAVRVRATEGCLALAGGDGAGARAAANDVRSGLGRLRAHVPRDRTRELGDVTSLLARSELVAAELARDPQSAGRDLELIGARLGAAYPVLLPGAR